MTVYIKFKNIKKIRLSIDCSDCVIKQEYESEYDSAYQKEIRRREKNAKNPVVIDFKKISNFNNIEELDFSFDENIGTRLKNTIELSKSKMNLLIPDKTFSIKEHNKDKQKSILRLLKNQNLKKNQLRIQKLKIKHLLLKNQLEIKYLKY